MIEYLMNLFSFNDFESDQKHTLCQFCADLSGGLPFSVQVISEVCERLSSFDSELKDARRRTEDVQKVL